MVNEKALNAFLAAKADIDQMMDKLKAMSEDHFGYHPDDINWGHVGTLNHYADILRQIVGESK